VTAPKRIVVVPDGMADHPQERLGGKTPVEAASTPHLDRIARGGTVGLVTTVPEGMVAGSDVANLSVFGYDPAAVYTGRAPLEAAGLGVRLSAADVAYRCNLVTVVDGAIRDPAAGYLPTAEAVRVVDVLNRSIGTPFEFYAGTSFRCLMVWRGGRETRTTPPQDIVGQPLERFLPRGEGGAALRGVMWRAAAALHGAHPRVTGIWLWGGGRSPALPAFSAMHGLSAVVVAAAQLVKGIGVAAGCEAPAVPGATAYIDTDYTAKAAAALAALRRHDLAFIHVEAPDEASHMKSLAEKIRAIEAIDRELLGRITRELPDAAVLVLPDHYTSVASGLHEALPVPFAYGTVATGGPASPGDPCGLGGGPLPAGCRCGGVADDRRMAGFSEREAAATGLVLTSGTALMDLFLRCAAARRDRLSPETTVCADPSR
jgi:2,3-bisphosphoglycerate-independent phosphoglycerate mutase